MGTLQTAAMTVFLTAWAVASRTIPSTMTGVEGLGTDRAMGTAITGAMATRGAGKLMDFYDLCLEMSLKSTCLVRGELTMDAG